MRSSETVYVEAFSLQTYAAAYDQCKKIAVMSIISIVCESLGNQPWVFHATSDEMGSQVHEICVDS